MENKIAMDILIPSETNADAEKCQKYIPNIRECFAKLSEKEKDEIFVAFDEKEKEEISVLKFPKFTMEYSTQNLKDILTEMGLSTVFNENAVFDKIAENLVANSITHKAKVEVNEKGTKASATTSILMENTAVTQKIAFIVNQPFIFVIRDIQTGTILFMGDMQNIEQPD